MRYVLCTICNAVVITHHEMSWAWANYQNLKMRPMVFDHYCTIKTESIEYLKS